MKERDPTELVFSIDFRDENKKLYEKLKGMVSDRKAKSAVLSRFFKSWYIPERSYWKKGVIGELYYSSLRPSEASFNPSTGDVRSVTEELDQRAFKKAQRKLQKNLDLGRFSADEKERITRYINRDWPAGWDTFVRSGIFKKPDAPSIKRIVSRFRAQNDDWDDPIEGIRSYAFSGRNPEEALEKIQEIFEEYDVS